MGRAQFWILGGLVLLAVGFVGWKSSRPPRVEVIIARLQDVTPTLAVSGVLEATTKTTVASQLNGGLVRDVRVDIGSLVKTGDVLVVLEDGEYRAQISAADAVIAQSDSQEHLQDVLETTALRNVSLAQQSVASVNDLRASVAREKTNQNIAQAKVRQSEINLETVIAGSRVEQVRIAKAQLSRALAVAELSNRDAERNSVLFQEGAISKRNNEVAQATFATSIQDVNSAREQVSLESSPRSEEVQTARSLASEARAALAGAIEAVKIAERVLGDRLVSRQQLLQAKGDVDAARASRKVSEATKRGGFAQKSSALAAQSKTVLTSPISGRVSQRLVEPGQVVSVGNPLLVLDGASQLRIKLNVEEASISLIKLGAKAIVGFDAFPELRLSAVVSDIGTSANFQLGTVEVRLRLLETDPRLKPQLTADSNIFVAAYTQVVSVPQSVLVSSGDVATVYVANRGVIEERRVKWTKGNTGNIIIQSGLNSGDLVVSNPRSTTPKAHVATFIAKQLGGN